MALAAVYGKKINEETYNFGKFNITKSTLTSLASRIDITQPFQLCSLQDNECVILRGVS